ncbi:MAG TPA: hypothetical protein VMV73_00250 [Candidatus Dormibacteraeota bacterium]|nr:hypothetical protein [Candidatus Dormibacteraeota bacterium]
MTTRKRFLTTSAALAALAPLFDAPQLQAAASSPQKTDDSIPPLQFDLRAFDAILKQPAEHRHLFASKWIDGGDVFYAMRTTLNAYRDIGITVSSVHPVAVLYHMGVILAFDDAVWNELVLPSLSVLDRKLRGDVPSDLKKGDGNPYLRQPLKKPNSASVVNEMRMEASVHYFICNNALQGFASTLAPALQMEAAAVYARFTAGLIPHATIVPAGVWAIHAVQERGYTLLQTSL